VAISPHYTRIENALASSEGYKGKAAADERERCRFRNRGCFSVPSAGQVSGSLTQVKSGDRSRGGRGVRGWIALAEDLQGRQHGSRSGAVMVFIKPWRLVVKGIQGEPELLDSPSLEKRRRVDESASRSCSTNVVERCDEIGVCVGQQKPTL
jgi:hypothetical protein